MRKNNIILTFTFAVLLFFTLSCGGSEDLSQTELTDDQASSLIAKIREDAAVTPEILTDAEIIEIQGKMRALEPEFVENGEFAVLDTDKGVIIFKFFTEEAPNHSANFKKLANSGFYDWVTFYRVVPGFMIQSGDIFSKNDDPSDDGSGHPGYSVNDEFNSIPFDKGIVGMAKRTTPNSAGCQFFFMHLAQHSLNGRYTAFGKIVYGLEVVDEIAKIKTRGERAVEKVYIRRARVIKP